MAHVNGTYRFDRVENLVDYLEALGLPKDIAEEHANRPRPDWEVKVDGNKVIFNRQPVVEFILGQEVNELIGNTEFKSTGTLNGNIFSVVMKEPKHPDRITNRTYTFSSDGFVHTFKTVGDNLSTPEVIEYCKRV